MNAYRAKILHFTDNPAVAGPSAAQFFSDGVLLIHDGKVVAVGEATSLRQAYPNVPVTDFSGKLIIPGFIDSHIHFPQVDVIASYADGLLPWLENHTFPAEQQFVESTHAVQTADFFLDQLIQSGTTTAMVFGTVHKSATEAYFAAAQKRNLRMIAGKCLMDRHCPAALSDTAETGAQDTDALIQRWHGTDRLHVAITPRFAVTSTEQQLILAGELARLHPSVFIQTHVAENRDEVAWIEKLFPQQRSYLDVYAHYGLLRARAIFAHGIYLDEEDRRAMAQSGAAIAVCPTSNLFLGSGLFDFEHTWQAGVMTPFATDVGGGTSYSMLRTMQAAYYVAQLQHQTLTPLSMFYWSTLGAARALHLSEHIGSFANGCEADFVVLDLQATPVMARRVACAESLQDLLFALAILGDERAVNATYIMGQQVYCKQD